MSEYLKAFESVIADPCYLSNLDWGEARPGHPEATVRTHIAELEANLEVLRPKVTHDEYWKLKLLVHTHDTFKRSSQPGAPIADPRSHASLARAFLVKYCQDGDLLSMVQYHDEPFALYRQLKSKGRVNRDRLDTLVTNIHDWNVFLAFNIIDGCTVGKSREPLYWFFGEVEGRVESRFTHRDIIP